MNKEGDYSKPNNYGVATNYDDLNMMDENSESLRKKKSWDSREFSRVINYK